MNDLITDLENARRSSIRILKIKKIWKIMNVGCV